MNNPEHISESLDFYYTCGEGTATSRILVEGENSYLVEFLLILHAAAASRGD